VSKAAQVETTNKIARLRFFLGRKANEWALADMRALDANPDAWLEIAARWGLDPDNMFGQERKS
jgi:hypothetical protein